MATPSSILAWKIPWMEEPGGLQSMGSQSVRYDWATPLSFTFSTQHTSWEHHSSNYPPLFCIFIYSLSTGIFHEHTNCTKVIPSFLTTTFLCSIFFFSVKLIKRVVYWYLHFIVSHSLFCNQDSVPSPPLNCLYQAYQCRLFSSPYHLVGAYTNTFDCLLLIEFFF